MRTVCLTGVSLVGVAHLVVEGCDKPQLHLQVGASLLGGNELQQVLVPHAGGAEDLPFTLPRLLVLRQGGSSVLPLRAPRQHSHPTHPSPCPVPGFPAPAPAKGIWRTRPTTTSEVADTSTLIYKRDHKHQEGCPVPASRCSTF